MKNTLKIMYNTGKQQKLSACLTTEDPYGCSRFKQTKVAHTVYAQLGNVRSGWLRDATNTRGVRRKRDWTGSQRTDFSVAVKNVYLSHLPVHEVPELTLQTFLLFRICSVSMVNLNEVSKLI